MPVPAAPGKALSDHSLLRRFRGGCQDAATQLYERYAHRLYALVKSKCPRELAACVEADDLLQSVFAIFFQKASKGCYDVPAGEDLWKLLLVITLNKIRGKAAFHAAAKRNAGLTSGGREFEWAVAHKEQDNLAEVFLRLVIAETIEPLPPTYRSMVELRIEGHEVAEIAKRTGRSQRTIERFLQKFRTRLAGILNDAPDS